MRSYKLCSYKKKSVLHIRMLLCSVRYKEIYDNKCCNNLSKFRRVQGGSSNISSKYNTIMVGETTKKVCLCSIFYQSILPLVLSTISLNISAITISLIAISSIHSLIGIVQFSIIVLKGLQISIFTWSTLRSSST